MHYTVDGTFASLIPAGFVLGDGTHAASCGAAPSPRADWLCDPARAGPFILPSVFNAQSGSGWGKSQGLTPGQGQQTQATEESIKRGRLTPTSAKQRFPPTEPNRAPYQRSEVFLHSFASATDRSRLLLDPSPNYQEQQSFLVCLRA